MNLRLFAVLPLAGLLWLGAPRSAHAQRAPVDAIAEADAHFKQGVQLFKQGRYDAALAEFRQAHGLAPD